MRSILLDMYRRILLCVLLAACTGTIGDLPPGDSTDGGTRYPDGTVVLDDGAVVFPDGYVPPPTTTWLPLRRLTDTELRTTVFAAFHTGDEWSDNAMRRFFVLTEPEPGDVFRNHTPELTVGVGAFEGLVESASRFASGYASWGVAQPDAQYECEALEPIACMELFIRDVGERLYRRPLMASEVESLLEVYRETSSALDEDAGFEGVVLSMVMAPQTLYLFETNDPALYPFHVAARLSYYLWRAPPDDGLRQKAADGSLLNDAVFEAEVARMMNDGRFYEAQTEFFLEVLDLTRFASYYKDASLDDSVDRVGMRDDFAANIRRVYESDGSLHDLFVDPLIFTDPLLAAFVPEGAPYPGILSHPVFTWTHSTYRVSSPIERGVTVVERLIRCGHLPAPPMNVSPLPAPGADTTVRERLAVHREDPACATCHDFIDPIGLTFESYDRHGVYRTTQSYWNNGWVDSGEPVDPSGELTGTDNDGPVDDLGGLVERMADSTTVQQCFTDQSLRYAVLRNLEGVDDAQREALMTRFTADDLRVATLVREIALSPIIRFEQGETP